MTKADKKRLDRLSQMGCVCCARYPVEIHHCVFNGYRRLSGGHQSTIPLDSWCHRGVPPDGFSVANAEFIIGPSLALNKKAFIAKYGTERELLEKVNHALNS